MVRFLRWDARKRSKGDENHSNLYCPSEQNCVEGPEHKAVPLWK